MLCPVFGLLSVPQELGHEGEEERELIAHRKLSGCKQDLKEMKALRS